MTLKPPDDLAAELVTYGRFAANSGLIYGNYGNLSARVGDVTYITKSGAMLGLLEKSDFVGFQKLIPEEASSDTPIHQGIYEKTGCGAIYHLHGEFTVILSWLRDIIVPEDFAGSRFLGEVNVVEGEFGTTDLNRKIVDKLQTRAVVVRGHGSFTIGSDLRQAYVISCALENSCRLLYFRDLYRGLTRTKEGK